MEGDIDKSWISNKIFFYLSIILVMILCMCILFFNTTFSAFFWISMSACFIVSSLILYLLYLKVMLSESGGGLQLKITDLVSNKIEDNARGRLLDIGCGGGMQSVRLSLRCSGLIIDALDCWEGIWGYSQEECMVTAYQYNVQNKVSFRQGTAQQLPFESCSFDYVISNMAFHEVSDIKDQKELIGKALNVLKEGGTFVFQDLFLSKRHYDSTDILLEYLQDRVEKVHFAKTKDLIYMPPLFRIAFGKTAIIYGTK